MCEVGGQLAGVASRLQPCAFQGETQAIGNTGRAFLLAHLHKTILKYLAFFISPAHHIRVFILFGDKEFKRMHL